MFGTMKRPMGFTYTLVRGKEKVLGEVGLVFMVYNLVRCASILRVPELINALKRGVCLFFNEKYDFFGAFIVHLIFWCGKKPDKINHDCIDLYCVTGRHYSYLYGYKEGFYTGSR